MRKRLTNKKINIVCDEVINELNDAINNNGMVFLCNSIESKLNCEKHEIIEFIPKFNYENAKIHANAYLYSEHSKCWWIYQFCGGYEQRKHDNIHVNENKIIFMQWLKSQYPVKESPVKKVN